MDWMKTCLTVFFDGRFWVALVEREDEHGLHLARHVFGPEPGQAEILRWIETGYRALRFFDAGEEPAHGDRHEKKINPKRAKREAARQAAAGNLRTRAQEAMRIIRESGRTPKKT